MSIAAEELHRARGPAHGEGEFHCFSGKAMKAMTLVSLCSWLFPHLENPGHTEL